MIELLDTHSPKALGFKLSGKLHDTDYKTFVPKLDEVIKEQGKVRLLAWFHNFHGWDLHAVWDDSVFAAKHMHTIEKVALVGEKKWEEQMAKVCGPFSKAKMKYFDAEEIDAAWAWLEED